MAKLTVEDRKEIVKLMRRYQTTRSLNEKEQISEEIARKVESSKAK